MARWLGSPVQFANAVQCARYLHIAFDAPLRLLHHARVRLVWAILRLRHPLLSAEVVMRDYDDVRFV